jgi:hypothetical protein
VATARASHPLFDVKGFVRNIEQAYEIMWNRFIQNRPSEAFGIKTTKSED